MSINTISSTALPNTSFFDGGKSLQAQMQDAPSPNVAAAIIAASVKQHASANEVNQLYDQARTKFRGRSSIDMLLAKFHPQASEVVKRMQEGRGAQNAAESAPGSGVATADIQSHNEAVKAKFAVPAQSGQSAPPATFPPQSKGGSQLVPVIQPEIHTGGSSASPQSQTVFTGLGTFSGNVPVQSAPSSWKGFSPLKDSEHYSKFAVGTSIENAALDQDGNIKLDNRKLGVLYVSEKNKDRVATKVQGSLMMNKPGEPEQGVHADLTYIRKAPGEQGGQTRLNAQVHEDNNPKTALFSARAEQVIGDAQRFKLSGGLYMPGEKAMPELGGFARAEYDSSPDSGKFSSNPEMMPNATALFSQTPQINGTTLTETTVGGGFYGKEADISFNVKRASGIGDNLTALNLSTKVRLSGDPDGQPPTSFKDPYGTAGGGISAFNPEGTGKTPGVVAYASAGLTLQKENPAKPDNNNAKLGAVYWDPNAELGQVSSAIAEFKSVDEEIGGVAGVYVKGPEVLGVPTYAHVFGGRDPISGASGYAGVGVAAKIQDNIYLEAGMKQSFDPKKDEEGRSFYGGLTVKF